MIAPRRLRLVAAACTLVSLLGASHGTAHAGDDGKRLTREQYVRRATAHCDTLKEASNELRKAQAPGATGKRVARFVRRAADSLLVLVRGFDRLRPPKALEADGDELVEMLDSYAEGLEELADRVRRGQTFRVALEENQGLVTRLNSIAQRATGLVTQLGLTGCLLPT